MISMLDAKWWCKKCGHPMEFGNIQTMFSRDCERCEPTRREFVYIHMTTANHNAGKMEGRAEPVKRIGVHLKDTDRKLELTEQQKKWIFPTSGEYAETDIVVYLSCMYCGVKTTNGHCRTFLGDELGYGYMCERCYDKTWCGMVVPNGFPQWLEELR